MRDVNVHPSIDVALALFVLPLWESLSLAERSVYHARAETLLGSRGDDTLALRRAYGLLDAVARRFWPRCLNDEGHPEVATCASELRPVVNPATARSVWRLCARYRGYNTYMGYKLRAACRAIERYKTPLECATHAAFHLGKAVEMACRPDVQSYPVPRLAYLDLLFGFIDEVAAYL